MKAKRSPYLVPYSFLDEKMRRVGRDSVREVVGTLLAFGYSLEPHSQTQGTAPKEKLCLFQINATLITNYCTEHRFITHMFSI